MKIHIKIQDKIYDVQIEDLLTRPIKANVNGEIFEVWPEETMVPSNVRRSESDPEAAIPVQQLEISKTPEKASSQETAINAPIPGVIIEVKIHEGDLVKYGQELCVLEAMKMKNSIRAGKAGTIEKVFVSPGDQVNQSQTLMEFRREEIS
jgi:glutaconyl-CoA/methylmalonyl-CoA decarboxylase subunit gamma